MSSQHTRDAVQPVALNIGPAVKKQAGLDGRAVENDEESDSDEPRRKSSKLAARKRRAAAARRVARLGAVADLWLSTGRNLHRISDVIELFHEPMGVFDDSDSLGVYRAALVFERGNEALRALVNAGNLDVAEFLVSGIGEYLAEILRITEDIKITMPTPAVEDNTAQPMPVIDFDTLPSNSGDMRRLLENIDAAERIVAKALAAGAAGAPMDLSAQI